MLPSGSGTPGNPDLLGQRSRPAMRAPCVAASASGRSLSGIGFGSSERGRFALSAVANRFGLGDKIRLIPGHCDPTVNLYDWYVCVRGNRVEQL